MCQQCKRSDGVASQLCTPPLNPAINHSTTFATCAFLKWKSQSSFSIIVKNGTMMIARIIPALPSEKVQNAWPQFCLNFGSILAHRGAAAFPSHQQQYTALAMECARKRGGWEWEFLLVEQYRTVLALTVCTIIKSLGWPKFRGVNLMDI